MAKRKSTQTQSHDKPKRGRKSVKQKNDDSSDEDEGMGSSMANSTVDFGELDLGVRSGKILTVKLRNFMCHSNLTVDFNVRTNLLVGQNGSGKSAILTALIIGLGSKANATNRSSSIKELIKTGESSATIEVHISNDGSDAYEYDRYGNRIVVVRHMTSSGASTYKLKSATGTVISTSRADLLKLILYMNIQVDNPVCVMTQDASRSFLRDSNPKKRYELFLKATQLDVIIEKLNACLQQTNTAKAKYVTQKRQYLNLKEIQKKAHEKLNQFKSMEPLKKETNRFKSERAWLHVVNEEEFARAANSELENTRRKRETCEQKLAKINVNDQEFNQQNIQLNEEIRQLEQKLTNEKQTMTEEKQKYRQALEQQTNNDRNRKRVETKLTKTKETIRILEENIQSELNSNKDHVEEMKRVNDEKLAELNTKLEDCESTLKSHRRELSIYNNTRDKCVDQLNAVKGQQTKLFDEKKNVETRIRLMHASPKENLKSFGDDIVRLVDTLEQYHKRGQFKKMPIGPLANFIEVKNAKYRQYVEDTLGGTLMAFCVDNNDDLVTFRTILKNSQMNITPQVICSKFLDTSYNVAGKCVTSDDQTVRLMDLIVVENPIVLNCLIDQCNIETILFTESFEHATHLTSKKENVPRNLFKLLLLEPYSEYFPAPAYRSYAKTSRPSRFLRINAAEREMYYKNDLMKIKEKIEANNVQIAQIQKKVNENKKLSEERQALIGELESNLTMFRLGITEIQSVEYPEDVDVEVMQSEVNDQTKVLDTLTKELQDENAKMDQLNANVEELKNNMRKVKEQLQIIENEIQEKQKAKDDISENSSKRDSMIAYYQKNIKTLTDAMVKYEREVEKIQEKLNRLEATAQKTGPRIEPTHSEDDLAKLIKRNETKLNAVNVSNETFETVAKQAEEADTNVQRSEDLLKVFSSTLKMIHNSVTMRMANVSKLKQFMITRTALYFTKIMKLRDIEGTLNFDSENHTLDIQVIPRDKDCANAVSKTTNLSGGERSYTTVAFLISLWSCVDHPFYFLDEYDVFTDQVNRMFMTRLLLGEAEKKPLQYTFLTPQDTSEIKQTQDLTILRLENPDR